ncbi:hypothetical protein VMT65_01080 [Nocardia sp. CDC153]|uniref:hypothetical protein n=1 Tax=Nocardia sp. CDC153 TaxID=3112167 RepID=UPI002DB6EF2F|nr:hypothetical protein [Nocardia sp. CDC153]MEC3951613.1 hypothetical protein [Nocardia sp. CDC153]
MFAQSVVVAAVLGGAVLPLSVPAESPTVSVVCHRGGVLTGTMVPGTGSAGQSIHREADVWGCSSPVLPGITSGHFTADLPWNSLDAPSPGQFAWDEGSVSRVIGQPNGLWTIVDGPGSGHTLRFDLAGEMNVWWYHWNNSMAVESLSFLD